MDCSICLEIIASSEESVLKCNHVFHMECISQWIQNSCPLCRQAIRSDYTWEIEFLMVLLENMKVEPDSIEKTNNIATIATLINQLIKGDSASDAAAVIVNNVIATTITSLTM